MSGIQVFMAQPADGAIVRRNLTVSGSFSQFNGVIIGSQIQFGVDGPIVTPQGGAWNFFWSGNIPNNIRPGQTFQIIVSAFGLMNGPDIAPGEPGPEISVDGQAIHTVTLEYVVPTLSVAPFQSPLVVKQVPYTFTFAGNAKEGGDAPYGITHLQYQLGSGPPTTVDGTTVSPNAPSANHDFSVGLSLQPGTYPLTVQASDAFGSVATVQKTITIYQYSPPVATGPQQETTLSNVPTTSSITSWTRLEPQCANADIAASTSARLFDPLWLLTRQWQMGEFQGEDAGTPIQARVRATNAVLARYYLGELAGLNNTAPAYDPTKVPLEALVERRRMRPASASDNRMLKLAVEAGLHFLHMVDLNATAKKYHAAFLTKYALQPLSAQAVAALDDATIRFVQMVAGRCPDARLLSVAFRPPAGGGPIVFDPALNIAAGDVAVVAQIATAWIAWYDSLFTEPAGPADDAWTPSRLEYAVSVSARFSAQTSDSMTFSANEFDHGQLDWSNFDWNVDSTLDTTADATFSSLNETTIPAPVSFHGTPAPRFWEMEDAKVAYGLTPAGPTDLAHLMMIEYANSYGNDWYLVPLTVRVGSVTRVDSLVVTDTFGVKSLVRPIGDPALPAPFFSMWQASARRKPGTTPSAPALNRFFLPPGIARSIDGAPVEDVLFMRDEMANVGWGIERNVEGGLEQPLSRATGVPAPAIPAPDAPPRYQLASAVRDNWIPLLPAEVMLNNMLTSVLKVGAVVQPDGSGKPHLAQSEVLNAQPNLQIFDEEIPREGVHITRRRRMTRWIDGSTWVWTAFRNDVGTGEGSAGLRFDQVLDRNSK
jgi:hypothetical protein